MKVLEIINIRLFDPNNQLQLKAVFNELGKASSEVCTTLYRNPAISGDWAVHIQWLDENRSHEKSSMALGLVDFFRSMGMVKHTLLISDQGLSVSSDDGGDLL